ncbi:hypothetical protein BCD67_23215 [Oscillatoriales cyanobacterium USR001]|nr:hypothetical protein BCD67_23215 [Oscillatoriales cyanobacterium USR001]
MAAAEKDAAVLLFIIEVSMAKRRNLKKEKALRNQAYARKFRKRKTTPFYSGGRGGQRSSDGGRQQNDMAAAET